MELDYKSKNHDSIIEPWVLCSSELIYLANPLIKTI